MMSHPALLFNGLTIALIAVAAGWDLRSRRIPNWLTLPVALLGLVLQLAFGGLAGSQQAVLGLLAGVGILLIPCLIGWVGGGDVKLLAAVGALQNPLLALYAGLYGVVLGGLLSTAIVAVRRGRTGPGGSAAAVRRVSLPYGPALALGAALALALGYGWT